MEAYILNKANTGNLYSICFRRLLFRCFYRRAKGRPFSPQNGRSFFMTKQTRDQTYFQLCPPQLGFHNK